MCRQRKTQFKDFRMACNSDVTPWASPFPSTHLINTAWDKTLVILLLVAIRTYVPTTRQGASRSQCTLYVSRHNATCNKQQHPLYLNDRNMELMSQSAALWNHQTEVLKNNTNIQLPKICKRTKCLEVSVFWVSYWIFQEANLYPTFPYEQVIPSSRRKTKHV